jgi:hypothetical protein
VKGERQFAKSYQISASPASNVATACALTIDMSVAKNLAVGEFSQEKMFSLDQTPQTKNASLIHDDDNLAIDSATIDTKIDEDNISSKIINQANTPNKLNNNQQSGKKLNAKDTISVPSPKIPQIAILDPKKKKMKILPARLTKNKITNRQKVERTKPIIIANGYLQDVG